MSNQLLGIIGSVLLMVIGIWKYFSRKSKYRREQAEQAKKDMDNANQNDYTGSLLDSFDSLRK